MEFIILAIGIAYILYRLIKDRSFSFSGKKQELTVEEIEIEFKKCGYNNISKRAFEYLKNDPYSPIRTNDLRTAGVVMRCYKWLCESATFKIDKLSKEELEKEIGIKIDEIPLDKSLPLGEASLKRTTLIKNHLLSQDGLRYQLFVKYLDNEDVYVQEFEKLIKNQK